MLLLRVILIAAGASLLAEPAKDGEVLHVKFRALCFQETIEGFGYMQGNDFLRIELPGDNFSSAHTYVGTNPLRLAVLTEEKEEPNPELLLAKRQFNEAQKIILSAGEEIKGLRTRLDILESEISEHGEKLTAGIRGQATRLRQEISEKEASASKFQQAADQARIIIEAPKERPPKSSPKDSKKHPERPKHAEHRDRTPLAEVKFPSSGRYLLIVNRTDQGAQVSVLDDRPGAFPFGSLQFINLSGKPVLIRFGEEQLPLKSGTKGTIRLSVEKNAYANGGIYLQDQDSPRLCSTLKVFKDDQIRILYFILPRDDGSQGLRVKAIEQRQTPEDLEPEPVSNSKEKSGKKI